MLLVALLIVLLAVAVAVLMIQGPLSGLALFLSVFCILLVSVFLLPAVASWVAAALGVFMLAFGKTMRTGRAEVRQLVLSIAFAAFAFHFTLAILDLAMSTREFSSDKALILAALERGVSITSLSPTAPLVACIALGALAGTLIAFQRLHYKRMTGSKSG